MSENFKNIYKLLKTLEKGMDVAEFDVKKISSTALGITEERWKRIMVMLVSNGLIEGVLIARDFSGIEIVMNNPAITLKGLEYLEENSLMKKASELAKGIVEIIT